MPHSSLVVDRIARRGRSAACRNGRCCASAAGTSAASYAAGWLTSWSTRRSRSSQVVPNRLQHEAADAPDGEGKQRHDAERAQPAGVQRLLGQARRHEAGDVDLLPIGLAAGAVERFEGMLIARLGEAAVAV